MLLFLAMMGLMAAVWAVVVLCLARYFGKPEALVELGEAIMSWLTR